MRALIFLHIILVTSCSMPQKQKNWQSIYKQELETAIQNDDDEAFRFFWPEYLKELNKKYN